VNHEPEIALVVSAEAWVDALHRHCADHGGARVRCLVLDPAVALDEDFDVLVAGERWPALTRPFVDALHAAGRSVLVVGDPQRRLDLVTRLGVDAVVDGTEGVTVLVDAVLALLPSGRPARRTAAPALVPVGGPAPGASAPGGPASRPRPFVVVGGPWGAGSTEVALALAARCVRRGARPAVVDADVTTPSLAVRLGLPLEPNLCTAVDAAAYGLGAVPGALFDLGEDWPVVLVGAPTRRSAAALVGSEVLAVGTVLADRYAPVVFDVSAGRASDDGGDVRAELVRAAAAVVAVGSATPVGVVRLAEWIATVGDVVAVPVHVVVNRAPTSRARRAELAGELQRSPHVAGLTFAPSDPRVEDASWSAGIVERGPFARAVDAVHRAAVMGVAHDVG
jgi:MinD-like ATPase involved in chromosome partitioning or flagellar assembly